MRTTIKLIAFGLGCAIAHDEKKRKEAELKKKKKKAPKRVIIIEI